MKHLRILLLILFSFINIQAETFKAGSYIIDMGVIPQTYDNGLKPYGMVYDMVIEKEVPLYWIIREGKSLYETDFSYDGKNYKAGSLVLPAVYVTAEIVAAITTWRAAGVVIDGPTAKNFDAPAYNYISSFPNAVLDDANHGLTEDLFYTHTSIPSNYWTTGTPGDIAVCTDVYALPHADPQNWTNEEIAAYIAYTDSKAQSFLWQGCHSVGAVEGHNHTPQRPELNITADVTIQVDNLFEILDDFPEITITTHVIIYALEVKLGKNVKITVAQGGSLELHTAQDGINYKEGSSITGVFTHTNDGGKSGDKSDGKIGKITTTLTINSDKQYESFAIEDGAPDGGYLHLFMLTTNGQIAWKDDIDYDFDNKNSPAYDYDTSAGDHPIMQIASPLDDANGGALSDGSQLIYIPRPDSDWRPTTTVAIWDPTNVNNTLNNNNPKKAALLAFGRTYGDPENGILIQHASHSARTGTEAQNVSSARIYGNLLLQASIEKRPIIAIIAPDDMTYPNGYQLQSTVRRGAAPFTFEWSTTCGGTFDNITLQNPIYTPDNNESANCILRVKVTDFCTRKNFATRLTNIHGFHPPLGVFNVTHQNESFVSGIDTTDTLHPDNALYTQISNMPFDVTLAALEADRQTLTPIYGNLILEIVNTAGITDEDPKSCEDAQLFADVTDTVIDQGNGLHFNNASLAHAQDITYPNAWDSVTFRVWSYDFGTQVNRINGIPVTYNIAGGAISITDEFPQAHAACADANSWACYKSIAQIYGSTVCARDEFIIRPKTYNITLSDTTFFGGQEYDFNVTAIDNANAIDSGYTTTIDQSDDKFIRRVLVPREAGDCAGSADLNGSNLADSLYFISGQGLSSSGAGAPPPTFTYDNVGDINFIVHDGIWTEKDQYKPWSGGTYSDCIENNSNYTHDVVDGKIGCAIEGASTLSFIADSFDNTLVLSNFNTATFTYIAQVENNTSDMYAEHNIGIQALLSTGAVATNYTANCFANDINYTLSLIDNQTLKWETTQDRIKYFTNADPTVTSMINSTTAQATFTSSESTFNNGISTQIVRFNFDRDQSEPDNPFKILNLDFNLTVTDGTTNGNDFDRANEQNATFYYARTRSSKYFYDDVDADSVITPIFIDVHCDLGFTGCDDLDINTVSGQINDFNWWLSWDHDRSRGDGNITLTAVANATVSPSNPNIDNSGAADKTVSVTHTSTTLPEIVDIDFITDDTAANYTNPWLIYNKDSAITAPSPFYRVRFIGSSGWAGHGDSGYVVGGASNIQKNRRLER